MDFKEVKDSGKRQAFSTGSVRDTRDGKGRFDLISPIFLRRLARHYENGAKKYGDHNWEKGQHLSRYLDSALRHINEYREGLRDEDHMIAAAWNIASFVHTQEMIGRGSLPKELDDLVSYMASADEAEAFNPPEQLDRLENLVSQGYNGETLWVKKDDVLAILAKLKVQTLK